MRVKIYQPAKSAMQSGRGKTQKWLVEPELPTARRPEPLMGWVASGDTLNQLRLEFASREEAVAYAKRCGYDYAIQAPAQRTLRPKSYADNFRYDRAR
jgi:hypothetical protein